MELISLLRIIQRWLWLILSMMVTTTLVLGFRLHMTEPIYEAQVKLQLTAPQQEDVALFDRYRSSNLRDEMTVARNNFIEVLQSREVYNRTTRQLGLEGEDVTYAMDVRPLRDSDFIYVTVRGRTPKLAEEIANAHVNAAIGYYGEVRAKPATAAKNFLAEQLRIAEEGFHSAEKALTEFRIQNGIAVLETELTIYQRLLEQLQLERNRRMLEGPTSRAIQATETLLDQLQLERERAYAQGDTDTVERFDEAIARHSAQLENLRKNTSATAHVDSILAKRRDELECLVALGAMYAVLQENARQARARYQLLLDKHTEAVLKEDTVQAASFIQIVEPALAPSQPAPIKLKVLLVLAVAGSLGLGVMLAFLLEYVTGPERSGLPAPASAPAEITE